MTDYYYRYDFIGDLRTQAHDPNLRARRIPSQEGASHQHHQLAAALGHLSEGEALFRISMWKDEASAAKYTLAECNSARNNGIAIPVLQRIRQDHPFFAYYHRDHDQHLAEFAWLFWRTAELTRGNAEWSLEGIPHDDIEVLQPDGAWVPFKQSGRTDGCPAAGFERLDLPRGRLKGDPGPTLWAREVSRLSAGGEKWIVVISPPHTSTSPRFHAGAQDMVQLLAEAILRR